MPRYISNYMWGKTPMIYMEIEHLENCISWCRRNRRGSDKIEQLREVLMLKYSEIFQSNRDEIPF